MRAAPTSDLGRRITVATAVTVAGITVAGCGSNGSDPDLTVFIAASLSDVFDELGVAYTESSGTEIEFNVAGSSALRLQLDEGAAADLFVPADPAQLDRLDVPIAGDPVVVATNRLVVASPADAPAVDLAQFADDDLLLGACSPQVPCGGYARVAFEATGIEPALDTEEPDVRSVAAKVAEGELDAGIVYATDVLADDRLVARPLPDAAHAAVSITYPIALLADTADVEEARRFVDFLLGPTAQDIFTRHGFGTP